VLSIDVSTEKTFSLGISHAKDILTVWTSYVGIHKILMCLQLLQETKLLESGMQGMENVLQPSIQKVSFIIRTCT